MKTFTKGVLITVVDDDDYRIAEYLASGWRETATVEKLKADIDARIAKALSDADKSNTSSGKKGKNTAPDKKVNDAVASTAVADYESETVDDGLIIGDNSNG